MTKHTKRKKKTELPCHWVDEHGFAVVPKNPVKENEVMSDTAFLLKKAKAAARPLPTPGS
jgi:hypothetical protein